MGERGFFTIIGLCFLLVAVICVKNIQESEAIYSFGASDFQAELELQNIADSSLTEAAEKIHLQPSLLPPGSPYVFRADRQYQISVSSPKKSSRLGDIQVKVFGERGDVEFLLRKYEMDGTAKDNFVEQKKGIVLISVASCSSRFSGKKIYRRSLAYITDDNQEFICYMNSL